VRAEAAYRLALDAKPASEEAVTNLVAVMLRAERGREAGRWLATYLTEQPKALFAYALAARVAAQLGNRAAALEWVGRGLEVSRTQQDRRQEAALRNLEERLRAP
jgi:predicted Zn-dependent protease